MDYLPLFFNLKNRQCLVIGGGNIAQRKASLLLDAGAVLRIVAPAIKDELAALNTKHGGNNLQQPFTHQHLDDVELVVAATDDAELNKRVSSQAQQRNIPVNVVDAPALSTIIFPAIIDRSPIVVAVSSGGASPVLARLLRTKIESLVPSAYGDLAHLVGGFREQVKKRFTTINIRRRFWEQVIEGPIADLVFSGQLEKAKTKLKSLLASDSPTSSGEVFLVGAGPGDPDLLTFKALRLMQKADVVLYDRLVSDAIVNLCRRDADRIYVGKRMADHSVPQDQINKKLVELAKAGKRVLRLKGGDPFIFGRGGEEIDELATNNIAFQVVPGITAASGCASYAGIPLTHRDYSQSVKFVTGHLKDGSLNLKWSELVHKNETVVFYMGLQGLAYICEHLIKAGRDKNTPVALIQKGTLPEQKVLLGTLETLPSIVTAAGAKAPTLIIVGEVVKLRDRLAWFDEV